MNTSAKAAGETGVNPHYVAYAAAHGKTPDEMKSHDREAWPGGCMCGFTLWISSMQQAFWEASPESFYDRYTIADLDAWSRFLQAAGRVEQRKECRHG